MTWLGFTGTQVGMTASQRAVVDAFLRTDMPEGVVHGDCTGADAHFDEIAYRYWIPRVIHPSNIPGKRANCGLLRPTFATVHEPAHPLARNHTIVLAVARMLATPKGPERRRSGTWSTVRLAVKFGRKVTIVMPDGAVEER